ncbi:MAG: hypothetical protein N4A53_08605 [Pelagimonas sp.]|jgi:hypothetical protein|nr:hypothetical protein [Pelagimonas sp.]
MPTAQLPAAPKDVLQIPSKDIPATLRGLIDTRSLTPLMREIHRQLLSEDQSLRSQSRAALRHLGFPD